MTDSGETVIYVCTRHKRRCTVNDQSAGEFTALVRHVDGMTGDPRELCDSKVFTRRIETTVQRADL